MKHTGGSFALFLMLMLCASLPGNATSILISWSANSEKDLQGYKVYCGTKSGAYGAPVVLGKVTSCSLTNATPGMTYYIAVTAYDTSGNESSSSPEVAAYIPGAIKLSSPLNGAYVSSTPRFSWSGSGFGSYKVYVSPGGVSYTSIYNSTGTACTMSSTFWSLLVPSGTTVYWYVKGAYPDGTVSTSTVFSFKKL
jgi:hypothetical protein